MEQKALQIGAAALALALLLRLGSVGETVPWEMGRTLLFLSSGRLVMETQPPQTQPATEPVVEEPTAEPAEEVGAVPVFGEGNLQAVRVDAPWAVDTLALLQTPLPWDLKSGKPTVLILHSHGTESYEKSGGYTETSPYRTRDTDYNLVSIGAEVAKLLEEGGIRVIHDRTLHDYPSYNASYSNARKTIKAHLKENPDICLVLDLHRDAAEDTSGRQKSDTVTIDGKSTSRLMLVMGSDKGRLSYPNWEKNLSLAVKLQAQLERDYPGLCRPIKLGTSRYNQDLSQGALLVEVGTAGDDHEEALQAARLLAKGILALAKGANI